MCHSEVQLINQYIFSRRTSPLLQHDFATLKQQYDDLYKRNAEAEAELEANIKNLLTHMDQQKGGGGKNNVPLDDDEIAELHEQVSLYKEQVDILQSQKLELEQEVAKAQKQTLDVRSERDQFWSNEIRKLQQALAQLRLERDKFKNSSSTLVQSQMDLSNLQKEHASLQKKFLATQVHLEECEKQVDEMDEREKAAQSNLANAERDLESLLKTLQTMERAADEARQREVATVKRENDHISKAESARLEKDQALQREAAVRQDLRRCEQRFEDELAAAHRKHDDDLQALYTRSKAIEQSLNTEIANLGLLLTESDVQKDKALREVRDTKETMEKVVNGLGNELSSLKSELGRAASRLTEAQVSLEESQNKSTRLETELVRAQEFVAKERNQWNEQMASLKMKNETLTNTNQQLQSQSIRLEEHMSTLSKELLDTKRASESTISRLQTRLQEAETGHKLSSEEWKQRLEEAYRLHELSEARTQELAHAQDLLATKWREENKSVRSHLTKLLQDEKAIVADLEKRVAEFEARVGQLVRERDQAMQFEQQYEQVRQAVECQSNVEPNRGGCLIIRLYVSLSFHFDSHFSQLKHSHELSMNDLSQRLQSVTQDLSLYASREPEYLSTQKALQQKLDRMEIEIKRVQRQYEAARKKAEFLETHQGTSLPTQQTNAPLPLQPALNIINQADQNIQPLPLASSLLPPTKKV